MTWHGWWIFPRVLDLANMWWRFPKERYSANKTTVLSWNFGNKKMKQTILTTISIYDRVQTVDCIRERKCGQIVTLSTLSARWACFVYFFVFLANWNLFDTSRGGVKTFYWPWLKPPVLRAQLPSGPDHHECEPGGRAKYSLGQNRKEVRNRSVKMRNSSVQCWLTRFLQKVDRIGSYSKQRDKHCQRHNGPRNWLRDLD